MLPPGGAELDIAILFADVRGSTQLGERLGPAEYASLLNRFYKAATETLIRHDAIIDKLIGDEVMALFIPGFCGPNYSTRRTTLSRAPSQGPGELLQTPVSQF
jgi:adenylate cyclase